MASCVHLLYALGTVGGVDAAGRDTLVYRGSNKRKRGGASGQATDSAGARRKRRRSGKITGIVKAWSELTEQQRASFHLLPRIRFTPD
ncbi:hypothetical protein PHMEG_00014142 [Phytophthora megakarya]|uniref:Uncharacterized protein n=1 Tax=Phytophthora megakarya TaxID=4795 RepID=A0A225W4J9_9STRA|nr:hypothetical protein PHMEG_00014142 [Phytophthora megakarya]